MPGQLAVLSIFGLRRKEQLRSLHGFWKSDLLYGGLPKALVAGGHRRSRRWSSGPSRPFAGGSGQPRRISSLRGRLLPVDCAERQDDSGKCNRGRRNVGFGAFHGRNPGPGRTKKWSLSRISELLFLSTRSGGETRSLQFERTH